MPLTFAKYLHERLLQALKQPGENITVPRALLEWLLGFIEKLIEDDARRKANDQANDKT